MATRPLGPGEMQFRYGRNWSRESSRVTKIILDGNGVKEENDVDLRQSIESVAAENAGLGRSQSSDCDVDWVTTAYIAAGDGSIQSPYQISFQDFEHWQNHVKFTQEFIHGSSPMLSSTLEIVDTYGAHGLDTLQAMFLWVSTDQCLNLFMRQSFNECKIDLLVFTNRLIDINAYRVHVEREERVLRREPFYAWWYFFVECVKRCEVLNDINFIGLNSIEATVGVVTEDRAKFLKSLGFSNHDEAKNYEDINKKLFAVGEEVDYGAMLSSILKTHLIHLLYSLQQIEQKNSGIEPQHFVNAERWIKSLTRRLDANEAYQVKAQKTTERLFAVLFNIMAQNDARLNYEVAKAAKEDSAAMREIALAAKQDSSAMRTISILTLVFLPMTSVSAVFSSTVFNFQNWGSKDAVASKGWWVFLLSCVLATAVTLLCWTFWPIPSAGSKFTAPWRRKGEKTADEESTLAKEGEKRSETGFEQTRYPNSDTLLSYQVPMRSQWRKRFEKRTGHHT